MSLPKTVLILALRIHCSCEFRSGFESPYRPFSSEGNSALLGRVCVLPYPIDAATDESRVVQSHLPARFQALPQ
jgi:hypothetical protein